jgi:hypothetical protein
MRPENIGQGSGQWQMSYDIASAWPRIMGVFYFNATPARGIYS